MTNTSMKTAIQRNRQRNKYRLVLSRIRLRFFEYEDAGKKDKATLLIAKIKRLIKATHD